MKENDKPVKVITYGTFDLLHEGHLRLLRRAKALGDHLIVGVTSDQFDANRGKLNVRDSLMVRISKVQATGLADEIIIEDYDGQKVNDIQQYGAAIFAIGSDWEGKFDYLADYCRVVYLERTAGVSSTQLRAETLGITRLGIAGTGSIADRFVAEALRVSGLELEAVAGSDPQQARTFAERNGIPRACADYGDLLATVDAVYLCGPNEQHFEQAKQALESGVHVLCEKPFTLSAEESCYLYALAEERGLVLLEAIKTAYCPGFIRLVALARSGVIGRIQCVDATFTKLALPGAPELAPPYGGSVTELASYPLLAISKILDCAPDTVSFDSFGLDEGVDGFTRISFRYPSAIASATVAIGAKSEGHLNISGTGGSIYVPAPWWKTTDVLVRFEDPSRNQELRFPYAGDGLRYEIAEFVSMIRDGRGASYKLRAKDSAFIAGIIGRFRGSGGRFDVVPGSVTVPLAAAG
ncbi:Gfo/Idh/MocA family oxidoreductase [Paenarthrobacter sp. DKR-5]|uniref:Gfo/Idh/MocA family oxidoreductase n=1 Tax=Paenarthrobacter sp. DKR-5 TaxID=2835535 RepID=UPI001BDD875B|nr:Gfo/Idh/MocA family oxidoreductase [Paenarthrobacter sp. DKR-5]MBT1002476.1 Gfo/Idh/MocA family oxidoreductase [Paenarthrobacter sp. DKR-5]